MGLFIVFANWFHLSSNIFLLLWNLSKLEGTAILSGMGRVSDYAGFRLERFDILLLRIRDHQKFASVCKPV